MDATHFGGSCSSLQVTYECSNINHARYLHDMLTPFTPILAALSASSPIFKLKLADTDLRWKVIENGNDTRNNEERNPESDSYMPKSRWSTVNHYISQH